MHTATSPSRFASPSSFSMLQMKSPRAKPPPVPLAALPVPPHQDALPVGRSDDDRGPTSPPPIALPPLTNAPTSPRYRGSDATRSLLATLLPFQRPPPVIPMDPRTLQPELDRWSSVVSLHPHVGRDYPVAQVDSWPLTSVNHAVASHSTVPPASPLSPRARKAQARHKLVDDSKSRPLLLQDLYAFLVSELAAIGQSMHTIPPSPSSSEESPHPPRLARLRVFRELFHRVIASFSVYAPLLSLIQDEYERVVTALQRKCQLLPQLHSELQSLEAQCVQEISRQQLDATRCHRTLQETLKQTQAKLTACAAHNAHLADATRKLEEELQAVQLRKDEMQRANHSLVSGMMRQDDTLRHVHERSREEGLALAQMTTKYHRACEEITELKVTVATLEEKVGGVHVAADKATIALLAKDLQETHSKLQTALAKTSDDPAENAPGTVLTRVLVKVLASNGVEMKADELVEMLRMHCLEGTSLSSASSLSRTIAMLMRAPSRTRLPIATKASCVAAASAPGDCALAGITASDLALGVERVAVTLSDKIALFHQQQHQVVHRTEYLANSTFLTETHETGARFSQANAQVLTRLLSTNDLIQAKGTGADVPEYLQYDGVVRQLYYDRRRVETLIAKVWAFKDDVERRGTHHHVHSGSGLVPLARVFAQHLQRCFPTRHEAVECAYNAVAALERFASASSDCRLFHLILQGQVPEEARSDQARELYMLHDTLFSLHREQKNQSANAMAGLPLAEVLRSLRRLFPWKTDLQLCALHRALLIDLRGSSTVDYTTLLMPHEDQNAKPLPGKPRAKSQFCECLRAQYIDDLLVYRRHLEHHIQQTVAEQQSVGNHSSSGEDESCGRMVSIRAVRECLQCADAAKPVQEINQLLCVTTGLTMDQILTQDAMMISVTQVLTRLPSLLVKPRGKFQVVGDSTVVTDITTSPSTE